VRNSNAGSVYLLFLSGKEVEKNVFYEEFSAKPFFGCTLCLGFLPARVKSIDTRAPKEQQRSSSWQRMVSRTRQCVGLGMSSALLQPAGVRSSDASILWFSASAGMWIFDFQIDSFALSEKSSIYYTQKNEFTEKNWLRKVNKTKDKRSFQAIIITTRTVRVL
jgi:hypothetical protein